MKIASVSCTSGARAVRCGLLGGSWVVLSRVVIIIVTLLVTPLRTTHEPPSREPKEPASFNIWVVAQLGFPFGYPKLGAVLY